jgi:hypothetical protein
VSCKVGVKSRVDRASLSAMGRCVWWKIVLLLLLLLLLLPRLLLFELQARRACIPAIGAMVLYDVCVTILEMKE